MASTPYERRKDYFKRYYQEHKDAFLQRNRKNRIKRTEREAFLEEVARKTDKEILAEMERKWRKAQGDVKS